MAKYMIHTLYGNKTYIEIDETELHTKLTPKEIDTIHILLAAMDEKGDVYIRGVGQTFISVIPANHGARVFDLH